ncbi:MFS transporter [Amycolatopsis sp. NPDC051903]|uniref:MFS transporter n=1 Tax=Amycolatopsis sp. NPDC051903 TaxID=3363936 RepID=UPI0037882969
MTVVPAPEAVPRGRLEVSHRTGFWFAAVAFTILMAFGTAPTPLWPLYAAHDGFSTTTLTVAFAMMVIGASVAFACFGHLSDLFGRRVVAASSLVVAIVASVTLALWPELPGLLLGRFLNGISTGLMASTATVYLHDLHGHARPHRASSPLPAVVSTMATLGGLALGPLVAGCVAQWSTDPLLITQAGFGVALLLCLGLVLVTPETLERRTVAKSRFSLVHRGHLGFSAASGTAFFSFAILGLLSAMGAKVLQDELHLGSHFMAGFAPFLMFGASALGLLLLWSFSVGQTLVAGMVVAPIGLALVVVSLVHPLLWLYLLALVLAGAGCGALFKGGVGRTHSVAVPHARAGVLATFFVIAYLGMGLPPILFSLTLASAGLAAAMAVFAVVLSIGAVIAATIGARWRAVEQG